MQRQQNQQNMNEMQEGIDDDVPVEEFEPTWRGYSYSDYPSMDMEKISSLGLQISDKQEGEFNLKIKYIKAVY